MPTSSNQDSTNKSTPRPSGWRRLLQISLVVVLLLASYVIYLQFVPRRGVLSEFQQVEFLDSHPVNQQSSDQLLIPKIAVAAPIAVGGWEVLDRNQVWHRFPERGNPADGGNTILAAHRYVFGWTPQQVSRASILYNINQLTIGDSIYVDYLGKRYVYRVTKKETVKPDASNIEAKTTEPRLTMYSCTLRGERDGREVIIAEPVLL